MTLLRWLHIMGAIVWIGGVTFVVLILRPALQKVPEHHLRRLVLGQVVTRMRRVVGAVIVAQVLTGVTLAWLHLDNWTAPFGTTWGRVLLWKVLLATGMIVLFMVVPRLLLSVGRQAPSADGPHSPPREAAAGRDGAAPRPAGERPDRGQKLGHLLHILLLVLGFGVVFLAKLLT